MNPVGEVRAFVRAALVVPVVPRRPDPPAAAHRRRIVAVLTIVVGAALLGWTLRLPTDSPRFVPASFVLAAVWTAGALGSGPLHLGRNRTRFGGTTRPFVQPVLLGALLLLVFLVGGVVISHVSWLRAPVDHLLAHAKAGPWPLVLTITVVNGIAEELFFRGALYAATPARPVVVTSIAYIAVTVLSGVPLLVVGAAALGVLTALERRVSGGVLSPIVTHLVWSVGMLVLLPQVLAVSA